MNEKLFSGKCFNASGYLNITPKDAYQELVSTDAVLLDVRKEDYLSYKRFDVPRVINIPLSEIEQKLDSVPRDIPLVVADSAGIRSKEAMLVLAENGFENIANLAGGLVEWERDELPLKIDDNERLDGSCACQMRATPKNNELKEEKTEKFMESNELKDIVKEKYAKIVNQSKEQNETSCCGAIGSCGVDYTIFSESYEKLDGYNPDADLGLGCGLPTEFAQIKLGDIVVDLGSGAGNDCFVARKLVGDTGKVIGLDFTEAMIAKARENAKKLDFTNVEFRLGDIENMPITANKADVVISNCVLNLVPDKEKAFSEIFRILKLGGHLSVSDVVIQGNLPENLKQVAEMYAGCVSGAIQLEDYLKIMANVGFNNIDVQKKKLIQIPDDILLKYLTPAELAEFKASKVGIFSITVYALKSKDCGPNCCC